MAELLVRVTDKTHSDFYINATIAKRGDVIVAKDDGWPWGTQERTAPYWRILRVPVTLDEASVLLAREPETDPAQPSRTRQARAFRLDIDRWPDVVAVRREAIIDLTARVPAAAWQGVLVRKPVIPDPNVLGRSPMVI